MSTFYCKRLRCSGVKRLTCIRRQLSTSILSGGTKVSNYLECDGCGQGKRIMAANPELVKEAGKRRPAKKRPETKRRIPPTRVEFPAFYHKQPDMTVDVKSTQATKKKNRQGSHRPAPAPARGKKKCAQCGREFTPTDPRQKYCKPCGTPGATSLRWRLKNPEKAKAMFNDYRRRNREKILAYQKGYYRKKKEAALAG